MNEQQYRGHSIEGYQGVYKVKVYDPDTDTYIILVYESKTEAFYVLGKAIAGRNVYRQTCT